MQATAQELDVNESVSKPFTLTINSFLRTFEANRAPLHGRPTVRARPAPLRRGPATRSR